MSTDTPQDHVTFTVDGREISAVRGELLISAAENAGVYIPRFCYHPRLPQVGMCRMCLVEVKGPRGFSLQPSCYVPVSDSMEIVTDSPKVKKAQDGVLEFLLINHPLDCPVCDKGGECPLQDQTLTYGPGESRFLEEKRHFEKPIAISELVYLDRERCIQCDRCTRFADVVAGEPLIEFIGRGDKTEVNVFPGRPFSSYFSGNTVQICPVGALTAVPYRFKARPWDLAQVESSCITCSMGCRIMVQSSQNEITRYIGLDSDPINHGWLCDKGRFGHEALNSSERLHSPLVRKEEGFVEVSWAAALDLIASKVRAAKSGSGSESIAFLTGARLTNEDLYAWVRLAKGVVGSDSIDAELGDGLDAEVVASLNRATIDDMAKAKVVLAFTGDIREEIPVLYLRLREAVRSGATKVVSVSSHPSSLDDLSALKIEANIDHLHLFARELFKSGSRFQEVADLLLSQGVDQSGEGLVVLIGRENLAWSSETAEAFALEISRQAPNTKFLVALGRSNFAGAMDVGAAPGLLPGRRLLASPPEELGRKWSVIPKRKGRSAGEIVGAAARGDIEVLFLVGSDPASDFTDSELARAGLDGAKFVVSIDTFMSESSAIADVVLPAAAFGEKSGTTTNLEGRVLSLNQKVTPPGLGRSDWVIASELALELGEDFGFESAGDVLGEIAAVSQLHFGLSWERVSRAGVIDGVLLPIKGSPVTVRSKAVLDPVSTPGIASVWNQGLASSKASFTEPSHAGQSNDTGTGVRETQTVTGGRDPIWPPSPSVPLGAMRLALSKKLYSPGVHLKNSPNLHYLVAEARCRISHADARHLGIDEGDSVRVSDSLGGEAVFEAEVSTELDAGLVELVKGTFAVSGFSPARSGRTVNYVKVEKV